MTTTTSSGPVTTAASLPAGTIESYRRNGFVHIPSVLSPDQVARYRAAAAAAHDRFESYHADDIFKQIVNLWRNDPVMAELTMNTNLAEIATALAGVPLRLWHDHLLVKKPHNKLPTEFHQDAPYWPHANSRHCLSAWIALVDVPVERGCMSFLPGSHQRHDIRAANLADATDLFAAAPDLAYSPRVTLPLRAGDCTFHTGYPAHTANSNDTDEYRYAHVVIYTDIDTTFDGKKHVVTDPLGLSIGDRLPDDTCPPLPR
jgi:ectoine hydroxylase-related dioxygenase (phytanoyl-CoA dioxygenase family)